MNPINPQTNPNPNPNPNPLPDEVILHILSRLPVKSLFRSKSVCKSWHRLSSDPYFTTLYNRVSSSNPAVLIEVIEPPYSSKSMLVSIDFISGVSEFSLAFLKDRVRVRASCNGLLCCASIADRGVYYVCNPMTREFRVLPRSSSSSRERGFARFYPDGEAALVGIVDYGEGFRVVLGGKHRVFGHRPERKFVCKVYDSRTNVWRKFSTMMMDDDGDDFSQVNKNQVVFADGKLHWLTMKCKFLLALELGCDSWRKIGLPDGIGCGMTDSRMCLLEMDGNVSVVRISDAWMSIWVLKDYETEMWEMVDKVSLRCIRGMVPGIFPVCQNSEVVFLATYKQVLSYHKRTGAWKEMYTLKNGSALPLWFSAHAFRSSISSCF